MRLFSVIIAALLPFLHVQGEIKGIVFDYGNVFMRFKGGKSPTLKFISDTFGVTYQEVLGEIKKNYQNALVAGGCDEQEYWHTFALNLNTPYPDNWMTQWQQFHMGEIEFNEELFILIDSLRERGYKVGLLSNQIESLSKAYQAANRMNNFDPLILSWEVKAAKPDLEIYQILLREIALKPEEILFIDDKEENLRVAETLGIHTIHYDFNLHSLDALRAQMQKEGIPSCP